MSVPYKSRLSCAWSRAIRQNRLYSRVFEKKAPVITGGDFWPLYSPGKISIWMMATPCEDNKFKLSLCEFEKPDKLTETIYRTYKKEPVGTYTRAEVQKRIKDWEEKMTKDDNGFNTQRRQPFKKSISPKPAN